MKVLSIKKSISTPIGYHHFLKAMCDETRRDIMDLLFKRTMNISRIAERITLDESTISYHLGLLMKCGLVKKGARVGKERYYLTDKKLLTQSLLQFNAAYVQRFKIDFPSMVSAS